MESNKFFKFLWRTNAIFIFCLAVVSLCCGLMIAALAISEMRAEKTPPPIAELTADAGNFEDDLRLRLPYSQKKAGHYTYLELRAGDDSYGKLSSYSQSQIRNIAAVNLKSGTTKWIFDGAQQQIEKYSSIVKSETSEEGKTINITTGFLLTVATSRADKSIIRDIWIMPPNGEDVRKVVSDISGSTDIERYDDNGLRLIIETDDTIEIYSLDPDALTLGEPITVTLP